MKILKCQRLSSFSVLFIGRLEEFSLIFEGSAKPKDESLIALAFFIIGRLGELYFILRKA